MSLDNIQLNTRVVADLYSNKLINLENDQTAGTSSTLLKTLEYLGSNAGQILLLIEEPEHKYLAENDLAFLSKILAAVNKNLADVAIINCYHNPSVNYDNLMEQLIPAKIIFFGVVAAEIGFPLNFAPNKPQNYNGQTYLSTVSLKVLQENVEDKKLFWGALKQLFPN